MLVAVPVVLALRALHVSRVRYEVEVGSFLALDRSYVATGVSPMDHELVEE